MKPKCLNANSFNKYSINALYPIATLKYNFDFIRNSSWNISTFLMVSLFLLFEEAGRREDVQNDVGGMRLSLVINMPIMLKVMPKCLGLFSANYGRL